MSTRVLALGLGLLSCASVGACGDDDAPPATRPDTGPREMGIPVDSGSTGDGLTNVREAYPGEMPIAPATECVVTTADAAERPSQTHVPTCSELTLPHVPPTGGNHYGIWASYRVYETPVPWGFLIHNMEHGGVVLAYDCPSGCPNVVSALTTIASEVTDATCPTGRNRMIVVPVPGLGVPIAAVAWGHQYKATCLDRASLTAFVGDHYGMAPEDLCGDGSEVATFCDPDGGIGDAGRRDMGASDSGSPEAGMPVDAGAPADAGSVSMDGDVPDAG